MTYETREAWLTGACEALAPLFKQLAGVDLPAMRVSVGFAGGRGKKASTLGQCWSTKSATDGVAQVFISPIMASRTQVLATLVHEGVHAVDDCKSGHKGAFVRMAKAMGLEGKWTATYAGNELESTLQSIADELGEYPHAALTVVAPLKKQTTRLIKIMCPSCEYTARTTAKWLEMGLPTCPCGTEMQESV